MDSADYPMRVRSRFLAIFVPVFVLAACTSSTETEGSPIERSYVVFAVNGNSPDTKTYYDVSGNRIAIPRGTLQFHKDGTVEEQLQYGIYFNNGVLNFASTDTVTGHYEWNQSQYDVSMPTATGSVLYSGAVHPSNDFVLLNRSWKKNDVTVKLTITYARSN
jgi:hypothetical protein